VRVFFALWPDAETRACIANAAAALRLAGDVRPVPPENYHVTLTFVGEITESQLAVLQQIGGSQRAPACTIMFDTCDYWPQSQVTVVAARITPTTLITLGTRLRQDFALHGSALNHRHLDPPLRAHVTLARKVAQAPGPQAMSPFLWSARSFSLVRSDTSGARSAYTVVDTWPLLDESPKL